MRVHLKTLGCRLNEAELETWAQDFINAGQQISPQLQDAEVVVINSCAVTADAARKSRQLIRKIHREQPSAKLVVSGCYATLNAQEAASLLGVDLVVSNQDKAQLVTKTLTELDLQTMPVMSTEAGANALFSRGRQRAFVKVQDGCRYRCTFCIVTLARGEEVSRSPIDIVKEINRLYTQGIQEIILTGVHLGGYGSDIASNLTALLRTILAETDIPRLRLGSLEPWDLPPDFFSLFANPRLLPHLHLPLQSGSDTVLRRMARRCKTAEFATLVAQARHTIPDFNVTSDIIVGFPGETEQEWQHSLAFIAEMGFGHLHIFSYSPREGTKAASLPAQVTAQVKKQRSQQLHQLAQTLKQQFVQTQLGKTFPILWEGQKQPLDAQTYWAFGYTPNYLRVACLVNNGQDVENSIRAARLVSTDGETIHAVLCD